VRLPSARENLTPSEIAVMLEIAALVVAEDAEMTSYRSNTRRISLVVFLPVENLVPNLLHLKSVFPIADMMIETTVLTIAGTIEITRFHVASRHFTCVLKVLVIVSYHFLVKS
jgi:hypothetical protein